MKHFAFLFLIALTLFSCTRKGCTDPDSDLYDYQAEVDDGNCTYHSDIVFWFDSLTAKKYRESGVKKLKVYADNQLLGSKSTDEFWRFAPSCGAENTITNYVNMGASNTQDIEYILYTENDTRITDSVWTIKANTCNRFKIE